ncbi:MAG: hypothetical protein KGZ92_03635 [Firmicutes bacterium]|nr:hypothetical protein [Dethiobacter sp.]MBS3888381.1 hypothetical protein [Bacillota bacterium]
MEVAVQKRSFLPQTRKRETILLIMLRDTSAAGLLMMSIVPGFLRVHFFGVLLALWAALAVLSNPKAFVRAYIVRNVQSYSVYLWLLIYGVFFFAGHMHGAGLDRVFNYAGIGFFMIFFRYYLECSDLIAVRVLSVFALICIFFVSLTTLRGLALNPMAARLLSTGIEELTIGLAGMGIGSYGFIYGLVFVVVAILGSTRAGTLAKHRFAAVALAVIFVYTIFSAAFTIALLLLAISVTLLLLKIKNTSHFAIATIYILLFLLVISPVVSTALHVLGDSVGHEALSERFHELAIISRTLSLESSISTAGRLGLIALSARTFLSAPILGVGGRYGVYVTYDVIGGHASFFDHLAQYGIVGAWLLFVSLYSNVRCVYRRLVLGTQKQTYLCAMITFFLLGCINTMMTVPIISMVFFVTPGVIYSLGIDTREQLMRKDGSRDGRL